MTGLLSIRIADHYLDLRLVKHARHVALGSSAAGSDAPLDPSTGYLDHAQAQDALVSQGILYVVQLFGPDECFDLVQKWLRKSEQGDKWNRCLIEGMIVLSETGARDEQTTPP